MMRDLRGILQSPAARIALACTLLVAVLGVVPACRESRSDASGIAANTPGTPAPAIERVQSVSNATSRLEVRTKLDIADMSIAQRAHLTITATSAGTPNTKATFPDVAEHLAGMTVISKSVQSSQRPDGHMVDTLELVLEPFLPGEKTLPAFQVRSGAGSKALSVNVEPITLRVRAAAPANAGEQTPMIGAKGPVPLAGDAQSIWARKPWLKWAIPSGASALIGVVVAIVLFFRRTSNHQELPVPHALRSLQLLNDSLSSLQPPPSHEAMARIASILREYLAADLGLSSVSASSTELADMSERLAVLAPKERQELASLVAEIDAARFSALAPPAGLATMYIQRARDLVNAISPFGMSGQRRQTRPHATHQPPTRMPSEVSA